MDGILLTDPAGIPMMKYRRPINVWYHCTVTKTQESKRDVTFTRMLRTILTSPGDNMKLNHSSIDPSVIFIQSFANAECSFQNTEASKTRTRY